MLELLKKEQNLNFVGGLGDGATAYPKAFKELFESKGCFQEDNFHLLRDIERLCSYLERKAYAAIQKVEDLVKKWQKEKASKEASEEESEEASEIVKKLEKARIEEDEKIRVYDDFYKISSWVSDALEMVDWPTVRFVIVKSTSGY